MDYQSTKRGNQEMAEGTGQTLILKAPNDHSPFSSTRDNPERPYEMRLWFKHSWNFSSVNVFQTSLWATQEAQHPSLSRHTLWLSILFSTFGCKNSIVFSKSSSKDKGFPSLRLIKEYRGPSTFAMKTSTYRHTLFYCSLKILCFLQMFVDTLCWVSLSVPFFQQHTLTSCLPTS